jgi:branched-chain amino acid transport system permease protein
VELFVEQVIDSLQVGVMLFLLASGLTLAFGIMGVINLAQGSLYMLGAFVAATAAAHGAPFVLALLCGALGACGAGIVLEVLLVRRLYDRDHLDQVLVTFGVILFVNELATIVWGRSPLYVSTPAALAGSVNLLGVPYPVYRLVVIGIGLAVAIGLYLLITHTRAGMLVRAGATHRDLVGALGVNVSRLFTFIFALGALLAGLAGAVVAPLFSVSVGMGEQILITTFVVVVVGGLGSVRGAFVAALLVAALDTFGRTYIPLALGHILSASAADTFGAGLSSISIYIFMALVLIWRPRGLFPLASR